MTLNFARGQRSAELGLRLRHVQAASRSADAQERMMSYNVGVHACGDGLMCRISDMRESGSRFSRVYSRSTVILKTVSKIELSSHAMTSVAVQTTRVVERRKQ